jgi:N-acetylglucosaminyl-diphospho-decaprenol L-rhamnosyltransferase
LRLRCISAYRAAPVNTPASGTGRRFAAIVVNYNGGAMLSACIRSCLDEGIPPAQIAVIDNGSRDGSMEDTAQRIPGLILIRNPCNAGFARAVNQGIRQGIRQADAEFLLLLNNDARLESDALAAFARSFDNRPNLALAGGQLRDPDGRLQSAFAPLPSVAEELIPLPLLRLLAPNRFRRKTLRTDPICVESVFGACLCVRAALLPRLGLLDEDYFFFYEEIDWCQRARRMGLEVWYLPSARAEHGGGVTANRFRGPARVEYQRSKLTFFRKTRHPASYLVVSASLVLRALINALACTAGCAATLFLNRKLRLKAATYGYLFLWHLLLRPARWGLPDKYPPGASIPTSK